jgi:hypothetical protein
MGQIAHRDYLELVGLIQWDFPDAVTGMLFSMPCVKIDGKAVFGVWEDDVVFRLPDEARDDALGLDGAHLFDVGGRRPPMRNWVVVPAEHGERWPALARAAVEWQLSAP